MSKLSDFISALTKNPIEVLKNLFQSLTNDANKGFSFKKLTAVVVLLLIVFLHVCLWRYELRVGNFTLFITVLSMDFGLFTALVGISTLHQVNLANQDPDKKDTPGGDKQ